MHENLGAANIEEIQSIQVFDNTGAPVLDAEGQPTFKDTNVVRNFSEDLNVLAFDFGTTYYTGYKDLRFGMSLQNFSQEKQYRQEYFPLPLTFKFGLAMDVTNIWMEPGVHNLTVAVDAVTPRDFGERMHFGAEYSFNRMFFFRGGYKSNYDEENLSLGGGVHYVRGNMGFDINYSYLNFDQFDSVNIISFDFQF